IFIILFSSSANAVGLDTSSEFLKWERGQKDYFLQVSVVTAITIATQVRKALGSCISDWYSSDAAIIKQRHDEVLGVMKRLPEHHPSAIVLAVLQKKCGKFAP
ncbi:MAG: hypothetical protein ABJO72_04310, partial [Hyphomicrobiales bacterium]